MYGGDKDIDHANAMAGELTERDRAEYENYFDNRNADKSNESEVNDR